MPRTLTAQETNLVESRRKTEKPSIYDPNGTQPTQVSNDMETWLILADKSTKQRTVDQINTLLKVEADKDYQALFKQVVEREAALTDQALADLAGQTATFDTWREDPGVSGFEDTAEIAWIMEEIQQGTNPVSEKDDINYHVSLREAANARLLTSKDSAASRETRLKAWLAALNAY